MSETFNDPDDLQLASSSSTERPYMVEPAEQVVIETVDGSSTSIPEEPEEPEELAMQPPTAAGSHQETSNEETSHEEIEQPETVSDLDIQQRGPPPGREERQDPSGRADLVPPPPNERIEGHPGQPSGNDSEDSDSAGSGSAPRRIRAELHLDSFLSDSGHFRRERPRGRRESILIDTPLRRSHRAFVRDGVRQSMGKVHTIRTPIDEALDENEEAEADGGDLQSKGNELLIDGRPLELQEEGRAELDFAPIRLWDKVERENLPADVRQVFVKSATAPILPKTNKLSAPKIVAAGAKLLAQVQNLQAQINRLRAHLAQYDAVDVCTIVIPVDVRTRVDLERKTYSLFDDYAQLHAAHVANSCTWYNRWVKSRYIHENMGLVYTFFQNNTEDSLWSKCLERYEEYNLIQRGGPLMAFLILQRIQDSSEQALELLRNQIKSLNIGKLPGEDVEQAVSMVKSTYRVLRCSSTATRTYVPTDFAKSVFKVFQTTTVPEFNEIFHKQALEIQTYADLHGTQPRWPSVTSVINLATNAYRRLKQAGIWDGKVKSQPGALVTGRPQRALTNRPATRPPTRPTPTSTGTGARPRPKCWNCDGEHLLVDCTAPRDQAKIDAARARYRAWRSSRGSRPRPRTTTGADGRPMILNRNGSYVLDQRRWRAMHYSASTESNSSRHAPRESSRVDSHPSSSSDSTSSSPPARTGSRAHVAFRADAIRSALRQAPGYSE